MCQSTTTPVTGPARNTVYFLEAARAARAPKPLPVSEAAAPADVLLTMVDAYSRALATQAEGVCAELRVAERGLDVLELLVMAPGGMLNDAVLVKALHRAGRQVGLIPLRAVLVDLARRRLISLDQPPRGVWVATLKGISQ